MTTPEDNISKDLDEILENILEQYFRKSVNVWHSGETPKERKPAKVKLKKEAKAQITTLINQARIDELNKLDIAILNAPLQPPLPILRNRLAELRNKE